MIGQLALEAEIRNMRIGELLAALIIAIVKGDLLEPLLQQHPNGERTMAGILRQKWASLNAGMIITNTYLRLSFWPWCACALQARVVHAK